MEAADYVSLFKGHIMAQAVSRQPRRPAFVSRSVHGGYVMDKVVLGWVFLQVLRFSLVSVILPMLHTDLHVHVVTRRTNG